MEQEIQLRVYRPSSGSFVTGVKEIWQFRELIFFFALRNIVVRYKQTIVGVGWAIIQPLFSSGVAAVVFGHFAKLPSEGSAYMAFVMCGVIPWKAFETAMTGASNSVTSEGGILQKVYFPKLTAVFSTLGVTLVDSFLQLFLLVIVLLVYNEPITMWLLLTPIVVLWAAMTGIAFGIWLAPLNVKFRDVRYALPFVLQIWMYAAPVVYSSEIVPKDKLFWYQLNPLNPIIETFRGLALGNNHLSLQSAVIAVTLTLLVLVSGIKFFKKMESTFADEI